MIGISNIYNSYTMNPISPISYDTATPISSGIKRQMRQNISV